MLIRIPWFPASFTLLLILCPCLIPTHSFSFRLPSASVLHHPSIRRNSIQLSSVAGDATESSVKEAVELGREKLQDKFPFPLDDWQLQAGGEILQGHNVIVCAPTGSGKTVCGEMGLHVAYEANQNAIYTTPLKALSNQKFSELRSVFGKSSVGLSTGDVSVNRGARITVMTTEVYRNIAWLSSEAEEASETTNAKGRGVGDVDLASNAIVVFDEFHYIGQPGRGGVWEESVITSPSHTQLVGLSATLPNAKELAMWMEGVTGRKTVLVDAGGSRPVPLRYLFATRKGIYPLFRDPDAGPGAPNGLLGLRGDGVPPIEEALKSKKKGFGKARKNHVETLPFPRGLRVNPVLKAATTKRKQTIESKLQRLKLKILQNQDNDDYDDDEWGGRPQRRYRNGELSPRDERRERDRITRNELRKAVPSLPALLERMKHKGLLPAIFFIFSRVGCDNAAASVTQFYSGPRNLDLDVEDIDGHGSDDDDDDDYKEPVMENRVRGPRQRSAKKKKQMLKDKQQRSFRQGSNYADDDVLLSMLDNILNPSVEQEGSKQTDDKSDNYQFYARAGFLTADQVREVDARIKQFNKDNVELAFDDATSEQFKFGIGSHHAGMLVAHKAFVEVLFRSGLMKACFATETLAAGINMPARSTVVCAMAKRGDSGLETLATMNMLQMSGRAGRRGMDTSGNCVVVMTPFEGEKEAAMILTKEIEPIVSQFSPSYALAVNLISRGGGKLSVARELVQKSFAMWQNQRETQHQEAPSSLNKNAATKLILGEARSLFFGAIADEFRIEVEKGTASSFDVDYLPLLIEMLEDKNLLKKTSLAYQGIAKRAETTRKSIALLEDELVAMKEDGEDNSSTTSDDLSTQTLEALFREDTAYLKEKIERQRSDCVELETELGFHPFTAMAVFTDQLLSGDSITARYLKDLLKSARGDATSEEQSITADELTAFAKSVYLLENTRAKAKKEAKRMKQLKGGEEEIDGAWKDMIALTRVLTAYGCLSMSHFDFDDKASDIELESYEISQAGRNVGMLSVDNALWLLVGMGGASDVVGASRGLDEFKQRMESFQLDMFGDGDYDDLDSLFGIGENDDDFDLLGSLEPKKQAKSAEETRKSEEETISLARAECRNLTKALLGLSPAELAGYVAGLLPEGSRRRDTTVPAPDMYQTLTVKQREATSICLSCAERFAEVQKICGIEPHEIEVELSSCEVVTAWANGATWTDALLLAPNSAPGDLTRMLSRVLDTLRQLGKLPYRAVRASDRMEDGPLQRLSLGIHPELREKCREAARAINRFPVKDPLPFEASPEDDVSDGLDDDQVEVEEPTESGAVSDGDPDDQIEGAAGD